MSDDPVTACVKQILTMTTDVLPLLGSSTDRGPWVFPWKAYAVWKGTGQAAVVVAQRGGHTNPPLKSQVAFPRLLVEAYVDPSRDGNGQVSGEDAFPRARTIVETVSGNLQNLDDWVIWGDLRVVICDPETDISVVDEPDTDRAARGYQFLDLTIG